MRLLLSFLLLCVSTLQGTAQTKIFSFSWTGAGGYTMQGALAFDEALLEGPLVLRDDVSCFLIEGFLDGDPVGRWGLGMLTPETSWRLHFSPFHKAFVTEGFLIDMPQAWNMNGAGTDCGVGGFGFNLGNIGQDLCLSNVMVEESRISPYTPFPAVPDPDYVFPEDACRGVMMLSDAEILKRTHVRESQIDLQEFRRHEAQRVVVQTRVTPDGEQGMTGRDDP